MFNINIVIFLIMHLVIDFRENHVKNMNYFEEINGLIINFCNDDIINQRK
jgi:hypothetical protein